MAKGSPADKAGVKAYDILLSYDEHQLYAPEQLVKLVQNDKSGRHAVLLVMSAGKEKKIDVTLGEHQVVASVRPHHRLAWPLEDMPSHITRPHDKELVWQSFDSMTLTRLDKNRFKADISYRDEKGKIEAQEFRGFAARDPQGHRKTKGPSCCRTRPAAAGPGPGTSVP